MERRTISPTMDANIERKLKDYLSQLQTKTSGQSDEDKTMSAIQNLTPMETLEEIYSRTWLDNTRVSLGNYFKEDEIPDLIRVLFDFCLGSWANQKIVCVGDYSDRLPPGYHCASKTLYDENYSESISLSDISRVFLQNIESHRPDMARIFDEEYSRAFEAYFLSS